jgi:uncharacterized ferritin-like protein (DUF455 family)
MKDGLTDTTADRARDARWGEAHPAPPDEGGREGPPQNDLRAEALRWLSSSQPDEKVAGVLRLADAWQQGRLTVDPGAALLPSGAVPGRPDRPELVPPSALRARAMHTVEGRAALIHALSHIEFNAINLALDAIWRFAGMPSEYYADWLRVAAEEATHFSLLSEHLVKLGFRYGDFPAHNGLWEMAERTCDEVLARIALVPRTLEARGLDASPPVRAKLAQAGDHAAAAILDVILRDEIGHVAIGNRWFAWLCAQQRLDPLTTYAELARRYKAPRLHGPFNLEARRAAGFTEQELGALAQRGSTLAV